MSDRCFALWNNEAGSPVHAYVEQRASLQGKEDHPARGAIPSRSGSA
jgi:hypothetical protein